MWNNSTLKPVDKCRVNVTNLENSKKHNVEFVVVSENFTPLLGKYASEQMQFITVNYNNICKLQNKELNAVDDIFHEYSDVFFL